MWTSHEAAWDHIILAHRRPGMTSLAVLYRGFSFVSFVASYLLFSALTFYGLHLSRSTPDRAARFYRGLCFVSLFLGVAGYSHVGADTNYLFEAIVFCSPFAAAGIYELCLRRRSRAWSAALVIQAAVICCVIGFKISSANGSADLPLAEAAEKLRNGYPKFGWIVGKQSDSLTVHLRDWSIHGPNVGDGISVWLLAHPQFDWVPVALRRDIDAGILTTIITSDFACSPSLSESLLPFPIAQPEAFVFREALVPGLCVYRRGPGHLSP